MKDLYNHRYYLLSLLLIWAFYFHKLLFFRQTLFQGDNFAISLQYNTYFFSHLKQGILPLWNPYIISGVPLILPTNILFFPTSLLFFVLQPEVVMNISMLTIYLTGSLSMYWFSFIRTQNKTAALMSAVIFMLSGLSAYHSSTYMTPLSFALFPLYLTLIHLALKAKSLSRSIYASFVLSLSYTSGHPLYVYLTILAGFLYTLFYPRISFRLKLTSQLIIGVIFIGLSAWIMLPQIEASLLSSRPIKNRDYAQTVSITPLALLTTLLPHLMGIPEIELTNNPGSQLYTGILPLLFTATALYSQKIRKQQVVIIVMLVTGILLSLGKYTPLYSLALYIPGLSLFRQPSYFITWYVLGASLMAGIKIAAAARNIKKYSQWKPKINLIIKLILLTLALISITSLLIIRNNPEAVRNILLTHTGNVLSKTLTINTTQKALLLVGIISKNVLFTSLLLLIYQQIIRKTSKKNTFIAITISTIVIDLWYLNSPFLKTISYSEFRQLYSTANAQEFLKNPNNRIRSEFSDEPRQWLNFEPTQHLFNKIKLVENTLSPNRNMAYDIRSILGFTTLTPNSTVHYLSDYKDLIVGVSQYDLKPGVSDIPTGSRFIITTKKELYAPPRFALIYSNQNVSIFEDTASTNRAFLIDKNGNLSNLVRITREEPNKLTLESFHPEDSRLVLLDTYYPGWTAQIDGNKTTINKYNNTFREIALPAGKHLVEFIYAPQLIQIGALTSAAATIVILIVFLLNIKSHSHIPERV